MAKVKISEFSANPANNTDIDGINIAENCPPSGINDAIRELMAQLKDFQAGTAGDSFNGPVGTTTAAAGAFTTLTASSTATLNTLASSGATLTGGTINGMAIGGTTAAAVSATTLTTSSTVTHNGGTANSVCFLNGSKVLTTGSALTFDGTNLGLATSSVGSLGSSIPTFELKGAITSRTGGVRLRSSDNSMDGNFFGAAGLFYFGTATNTDLAFTYGGSEAMRLTSTGLGIGTSSPASALDVSSASSDAVASLTASGVQRWQLKTERSTGSFLVYDQTGTATRLTLNSSGNLGLGVTPSAWAAGIAALEMKDGSVLAAAGTSINYACNAYYDTAWRYKVSGAASYFRQLNGAYQFFTAPSGTAGNAISFTQAMTLDASGSLLVGLTSSISPDTRLHLKNATSTQTVAWVWNATSSGNADLIAFGTESSITQRGSITYNRGAGLVAYNVTSDYRAKDIIGPVTDSGALIDSVPVYMGKMKGATQERPMFIAHEVPAYAHTGEKDAVDADGNPVYQQMDASALVPVMWAEIQSLRKRLAAAGI